MKTFRALFLLAFVFIFPFVVNAQTSKSNTPVLDSTIVEREPYYKTAEIAFEIENTMRYVKEKNKQIKAYQNVADIDSSFVRLSANIDKEFDDFSTFNKSNLSKFFLLNTKKVWSGYKSQLMSWQTGLSVRVTELMEISTKIKEKEKLWAATSNQADIKLLPDVINTKITSSIWELHKLERNLFNVVGELSVLESKIAEQVIEVEQHIAEIDELHKNYRVNILKITQPVIWKVKFKGSYEGTILERLKKVWYENTKSLKDSIPSLRGDLNNFILFSLIIIVLILGLRFWYLKQRGEKPLKDHDIQQIDN